MRAIGNVLIAQTTTLHTRRIESSKMLINRDWLDFSDLNSFFFEHSQLFEFIFGIRVVVVSDSSKLTVSHIHSRMVEKKRGKTPIERFWFFEREKCETTMERPNGKRNSNNNDNNKCFKLKCTKRI